MKVEKSAVAGTLESSDAMVTIEPGESGIELELSSVVFHQYGAQIQKLVYDTLHNLGVEDAKISIVDKGALDCTLKARIECAVFRSNGIVDNLPWGGAIR